MLIMHQFKLFSRYNFMLLGMSPINEPAVNSGGLKAEKRNVGEKKRRRKETSEKRNVGFCVRPYTSAF